MLRGGVVLMNARLAIVLIAVAALFAPPAAEASPALEMTQAECLDCNAEPILKFVHDAVDLVCGIEPVGAC